MTIRPGEAAGRVPTPPNPSPAPPEPSPKPLLFDRAFLRDGLVTLVATFLGAGLAFWTSQYQADRNARDSVAAMIGFMRDDCGEALKDLQGVKIADTPAVLTPTATLLTLATNPTFVGAIPADKRAKLVQTIYAFNRAGNDYATAANAFDTYMKLHAGEFERLRSGQNVTFIPGPPARSAEDDERRRRAWQPGEDAYKAGLIRQQQSLLSTLNGALATVRTRHLKLCGTLKAASQS